MEPWEAPVRLLPLPLPPVHGEVFGWYLHRLAAANHVTSGQLAKTLTPFKNALIGKRRTRYGAGLRWFCRGLHS